MDVLCIGEALIDFVSRERGASFIQIEEGEYVIAQASVAVDENGKLIEGLVSCRYKDEFTLASSDTDPSSSKKA